MVVCAHDSGRWPQIGEAVQSLRAQTVAPHQVVLVVDHNEALLARTLQAGLVTAVANHHERGLGGARNSGVEQSSGDVVAFLDDDAVACATWIETIANAYSDPAVAGVGGGAVPNWEVDRPAWFPREFDWVVGCSYLGMPERPTAVRNVFGCNMSFRREVLDELGGFRLGYGCDETEFCIRLRQRWPERKVMYVPAAEVSHYVPESRTRLRRFLSRCRFEGGSKAVVSRLVGSDQALATEMQYTRVVLTRGIARGLLDLAWRRDRHGLGRAMALLGGLGSAALGYALALVQIDRAAHARGWSGPSLRRGAARTDPAGASVDEARAHPS